jgi:putative sigma-54 modulation protein
MRIEVRGHGLELSPELKEHASRRIRFALSRYGDHVRLVRVRLEDTNGPRGGVDKECRLQVVGPRIGQAVVTARAADPLDAVDQAARTAQRTVRRAVDRWRTTLVPPRSPSLRTAS